MNSRYKRRFFLFFVAVALLLPASAAARSFGGSHGFCEGHNYSGNDKVSVNDLREMNISATNVLTVDGKKNGGIRVSGEDRSDVLVRACVQVWAKTEAEAQSIARSVRIETGSVVQAADTPDGNWSVSYDIRVPRSTNLKLTAQNGGISIDSVNGNMDFETRNGGIKLDSVGGSVKGKTQNGGVKISLAGTAFNGSGIDVETQNGGVKLNLPKNFAANIETGTVNGGFSSDFPELKIEKDSRDNGWARNKKVSASINGGGAAIRVVTTNGGVKISSSDN